MPENNSELSEPKKKLAQEQQRRDAFICVPGLNWDPETSAVDVFARRFVAAFERNAPAKAKFKTSEGKQQNFRNAKRSTRVITVERINDEGPATPILDLYELNYHKELVDRFTSRHFLSQAASLSLQLFALIPALSRASTCKAKKWSARLRLLSGWLLMFVLMLYLIMTVFTGVSTVLIKVEAEMSSGASNRQAEATNQNANAPNSSATAPAGTRSTVANQPEGSSNSQNAGPSSKKKLVDEGQNSGKSTNDDNSRKEESGKGQDGNKAKDETDKGGIAPGRSTTSTLRHLTPSPVAAGPDIPMLADWDKKILPKFQWLVIVVTASGIFFRKSLKEVITAVASKASSAIDYLRLGTSKRDVLGQFTSLLDFIGEQDRHDRIHVLSYSFGTIVALDSVFPENEPSSQIGNINTLITIGSPFDIVRASWPNYFSGRHRASESLRWINIYAAIDILSSNFRDDDQPLKAEFGIALASSVENKPVVPGLNSDFDSGVQPGFSAADLFVNAQYHGCYWGESDDADSCLDTIVRELFAESPVLK